ncbi:MAG: hypothetical protein HQL35_11015 [Alphaproteobacteria bacterium]|nr:hypothetical protein [Alphaproteobacteria bacterium]
MDKSELARKPGTGVPGYTPELGTRIAQAIEGVGGLKAAARIVGVSDESLAQWRDGRARPSFFGLQHLASAAGVSMDWLATGEEPEKDAPVTGAALSKIDLALLTDVIRLIEDWLSNADRKMSPSKKAEVIVMAYEMIEERPTGTSQESYHNNVVRLLRVAS